MSSSFSFQVLPKCLVLACLCERERAEMPEGGLLVGPVSWQFSCWSPRSALGLGAWCASPGTSGPLSPPVGLCVPTSSPALCTQGRAVCQCGACFRVDVYSRFTCWFRFLTPETCLSDPSQLWLGYARGPFGRTCLHSMQLGSAAASSDFLLPLEEAALHSFERTYFPQPF